MQIKTTLRLYLTPDRTGIIKNTPTNVGEDARKKEPLIHCWWECKLVQRLQKTRCRFLKELNIGPATPLLVIYSKECNSGYSKGTCTPIFIAALFTIVKLWKQPRCPTTNEWIKKMWYLYSMEFYLATKKNEILSFGSKWMQLENIILTEVSKAQKAKKIVCSPSYADFRPKTNAVILLDMGHVLRGECILEE
jgi:hypothetical protein